MSDFITTENKSIGKNYQINTTKVKLNECRSVKVTNHHPELMKVTRPFMVNHGEEFPRREDCTERRGRRSVDAGLLCYRLEGHESPGKALCGDCEEGAAKSTAASSRGIRSTANLSHAFLEQYRDVLVHNNSKVISNQSVTQEKGNVPSNTTTYCTNGSQINKIKTANSSGSSFVVQIQPQLFTSGSQSLQQTDRNDLRNQFKLIKSQNVAFSVQNNDIILYKNGDEVIKNINPKIVNLINDGSLKLVDFNNISFKSNSNLPTTNILGRKESIPECYEPEMCEVVNGTYADNVDLRSPPDTMEDNLSSFNTREETLLPTDYLYSNNCYLPTVNINETGNSMSYINQSMPVVVLNNTVVPNTVSLNKFSQFCLTQLPPFTNDNITIANSTPTDQNYQRLKNSECTEYTLLSKESLNGTQVSNAVTERSQQPLHYPLNNGLKNANNYSKMIDEVAESKSMVVDSIIKSTDITASCEDTVINSDSRLIDSDKDVDVKMVGKFTVKTSRENDKLLSLINLPETTEDVCNSSINLSKDISNEDLNKNTNSDNQQPRSRFKKTRIRETIERWHVNGLYTYDCRFKVIPSKIMELRHNGFDNLSKDFTHNLCQQCGDHDSAFRCYLNEYNNKEFRFWDNGDRIAICGKQDCELENHCQFHAKYLKLLNQNQNISLSKFVPQSFNCPNSTLSSSPQIIRAVLISTPDNDNYTTNIDINVSQNVALSAPPVSPSQINSIPTSSLPHNLHSPQSSAAMVMLRCHTPVIWSNASLNASLMSESISIEKINCKPSSIMSMNLDNGARTSQSILLTDGNSLMEMVQNISTKHDTSHYTLPPSSNIFETDFVEELQCEGEVYNGQKAIYSMGNIPRILYSIPQDVIPTISTTINSKRKQENLPRLTSLEEYGVSTPLSSSLMQDIDDNLNSLKTMIRSLVQAEQVTLINEIKSLSQANESLQKELHNVKKRSEYLENILKENHLEAKYCDGEFDSSALDHHLSGLNRGSDHEPSDS